MLGSVFLFPYLTHCLNVKISPTQRFLVKPIPASPARRSLISGCLEWQRGAVFPATDPLVLTGSSHPHPLQGHTEYCNLNPRSIALAIWFSDEFFS